MTFGHYVREITFGHSLGPHDTLTLGQKGFIWKSRSNLRTKTHGYLLLKSNHIVSLRLLYYDFSRGLN